MKHSDRTRDGPLDERRKGAFERRRAVLGEAETLAHAPHHFLALVSHELRTPLNAIGSWAQVLENQLEQCADAREDPIVERALQGIRRGVRQQASLVDDLLDATMAIGGRLRLDHRPERLQTILEQALDAQRDAADERDVTLQSRLELDGVEVVADARRMVRAFEHLIENAIKFSPSAETVRVEAIVSGSRVSVRIEDRGQGISPDVRDALFSPFFKIDDSSSRRTGGLGLGLTLARLLVELHGGRIALDSAGPGSGTLVTVDLPLRPVPAVIDTDVLRGDHPVDERRQLADLDILVIDDQLEAREALCLLLRQFGARVSASTSAQAGLSAVESAAHPPDAVICDIAMPDEDGYAFLHRFRQYEARRMRDHDDPPRGRIPVIALSAFVESFESDVPGQDFDDHLTKPVAADVLLDRIVRVVSRQ